MGASCIVLFIGHQSHWKNSETLTRKFLNISTSFTSKEFLSELDVGGDP